MDLTKDEEQAVNMTRAANLLNKLLPQNVHRINPDQLTTDGEAFKRKVEKHDEGGEKDGGGVILANSDQLVTTWYYRVTWVSSEDAPFFHCESQSAHSGEEVDSLIWKFVNEGALLIDITVSIWWEGK